jgi:hypothetical protein
MMLARFHVKALLTNRSLWFWGVAFGIFWLVIGAFLESQGVSLTGPALSSYAAAWYVVIVLLSLSMLAGVISVSLTYGSFALAYSFRYTRLTPGGYFLSILTASGLLGFCLSFLMLGGTVGLFGLRFDAVLRPSNWPALVATSLLAGVFYMALATTLMLVVINYLGLKNTGFVNYLPLLFSYAFGLGQVYARLPDALLYASPFNDLTSLLYQGFTGAATPVEISGTYAAVLSWPWLAASLVLWTVALSLLAAFLLRRIRARQLEEGRQV